MKDNRGITLVELLVSIAIFSVVATILGSIVSMSIKFYSSEKVDAGMQYEGQIALNGIMDAIMQTNGIAILNDTISVPGAGGAMVDKNVTEALFLGEFFTLGGSYHFTGKVVLGDYSSSAAALYMIEYADFSGGVNVDSTIADIVNDFALKTAAEKKNYLLAERISTLLIEPAPRSVSAVDVSNSVFFNPFFVDIEIVLETQTPKGLEMQTVRDTAMIRNTLDIVYYGGIDYAKNE